MKLMRIQREARHEKLQKKLKSQKISETMHSSKEILQQKFALYSHNQVPLAIQLQQNLKQLQTKRNV